MAVVAELAFLQVMLTTYEMILSEKTFLSKFNWKVLIVDEAHRLKNASSRITQDLSSFKREHSVLLTGTPLQNTTEELWSLLNFLDPKRFGDSADFIERFGSLTDSSQVEELHSILKPYLLRRMKDDVDTKLPPKQETVIEVRSW